MEEGIYDKQELVSKVKAWQKMSDSHKEAWYRFVKEMTGETNFDPNRHDEATLMTFTQMADLGQIELKEATGFGGRNRGKPSGGWSGGGDSWATPEKKDMVDRVKSWQRMSTSHKEAWYRFIQEKTGKTEFDPNRHDETILMEFLQLADADQIELKDATGFGSSGKKGGKGAGSWGGGGDSWGSSWGGGGDDWGGGGDDWGAMQEMMMKMMMEMMSGKGKGGKGGKSGKSASSPY